MTADHFGKFAEQIKPRPYMDHDVRSILDAPVLEARGGGYSSTLLDPVVHVPVKSFNIQSPSCSLETQNVGLMGARYENSLFSSSWSELFTRKFKQAPNPSLLGHSVDTAAPFEDDEPFESLEDVEAQTIGDLLPDDDELLSGLTDGIKQMDLSACNDDVEDLDFFSSVGGMDLGDDCIPLSQRTCEFFGLGGSGVSAVGEHPFGEHPSRTLFVRNINSNVEDSELMELFEQYGDIRTLYTACKNRGFVMISYYDIRSARNAMKSLQSKPLRRRKLDIHFSIPKDNPSEKDINQGTLVVFNLDSSVSNEELHRIFGVYGEIKEIRETPHRSNHKFIEFYDVRAAEAALHALNRSDIAGKRIKLEHSRHGRRSMHQLPLEFEQEDSGPCVHPYNTTYDSTAVFPVSHAPVSPFLENALPAGISCSVPNNLMTLPSGGFVESSQSQRYLKVEPQMSAGLHSHSFPEYHEGLVTGFISKPGPLVNSMTSESIENGNLGRFTDVGFGAGNGSGSPCHYIWNRPQQLQSSSMIWSTGNSFMNNLCPVHPPPRINGFPCGPSPMLRTGGPINLHHVGSAPTINPSIWDTQRMYSRESPEASGFLPGSCGMRISKSQLQAPFEFIPQNVFPPVRGLHSHHPKCMMFPSNGQMVPVVSACDAPRSRRNESLSTQTENKKQYELDIDRILRGEDNRTTLMIKNIPNKYTSKMLLATIDENHRGTYDFIYLPIDFKNKCNVGYAFINMTEASQIIPFYQAFNGKKWEKFNSEKVASLAYARIQGKTALIAHFQNSSLMNEDKRCRPILFHTEGPNAGDQVPFPIGVNVRCRPGRGRNGVDCPSNSAEIEATANKDLSAPSLEFVS